MSRDINDCVPVAINGSLIQSNERFQTGIAVAAGATVNVAQIDLMNYRRASFAALESNSLQHSFKVGWRPAIKIPGVTSLDAITYGGSATGIGNYVNFDVKSPSGFFYINNLDTVGHNYDLTTYLFGN